MTDATEQMVKCTRCRNVHAEDDRPESRPDSQGFRHSECPRCGGRTFRRLQRKEEELRADD